MCRSKKRCNFTISMESVYAAQNIGGGGHFKKPLFISLFTAFFVGQLFTFSLSYSNPFLKATNLEVRL